VTALQILTPLVAMALIVAAGAYWMLAIQQRDLGPPANAAYRYGPKR
jgi:hypothetical protein